jgi:PmbA protein
VLARALRSGVAGPEDFVQGLLRRTERLTLEYEPGSRTPLVSTGTSLQARVRAWRGGKHAVVEGRVFAPEELSSLVESALSRAGSGTPLPLPAPHPEQSLPSRPAGGLEGARVARRAGELVDALTPCGGRFQALLCQQQEAFQVIADSAGSRGLEWLPHEQLSVRWEMPSGGVADGAGAPVLDGSWSLTPLVERLRDALGTLAEPGSAPEPSLPWVLRPPVAAPLVAGLAGLLRGDVGAQVAALRQSLGRQVFPSVLTLLSEPRHPAAPVHRSEDDQGTPAASLALVRDGRLQTFAHSAESAAALGCPPNGCAWASEEQGPTPGLLNAHVAPREGALPEDRLELTARVETFTLQPSAGVVAMIVAGWEVRGGQRQRRVAPFEVTLPLLATWRRLRGVGADLSFLPTVEGCGTPTLIFPPLF